MAPHWRAPRRPSSWGVLRLRRRWPPRLVFATPQDRVVLDLCQPCIFSPGARFRFFGLDIWATESKTRVPRHKMASPSHFRQTLGALLQSLTSCQHHATQGTLCHRVRTVVPREQFLNFSIIAEGRNVDCRCGTFLFQPTQMPLQSDVVQTSSTHCGMFQINRKRQKTHRVATNLVSLLATNHIQFVPRKHVSPTRSVPLRRSFQALVVLLWFADFVCVFRCIQASLMVSLRLFVNALTKQKRVSLRSANQQIF